MAFDAARYPDAVTFGWLIYRGMDVGLPSVRASRRGEGQLASVRAGNASAGLCWPLQMHKVRIAADRSAARVAERRRAVKEAYAVESGNPG